MHCSFQSTAAVRAWRAREHGAVFLPARGKGAREMLAGVPSTQEGLSGFLLGFTIQVGYSILMTEHKPFKVLEL